MSASEGLTTVLHAARSGDRESVDRLFQMVYAELQRIAHGQRVKWWGDDTMNTTALVHEAYLKLVKQQEVDWQDRAHFYAVAATAMRHILVNYAERRMAAKRGSGSPHISLDAANPVAAEGAADLLALDAALEELGRLEKRQSRVVECRFFGGLTIRETAAALGTSTATVERDWTLASAWLRRALDDTPLASK
jgi:RNA polymerase sigma factor (TIGR02999 family)